MPGVLRAVWPPRGCGQVAYLHGVAGHVLRPPARGPSAEEGLASARAGAAGGAVPRPSQARGALRPAALGPAWPGLRRAAPSGPSGCRMGHVSAEVRAWGGGGAGAGLPAAPGACSGEWGPCWLYGVASAPRSVGGTPSGPKRPRASEALSSASDPSECNGHHPPPPPTHTWPSCTEASFLPFLRRQAQGESDFKAQCPGPWGNTVPLRNRMSVKLNEEE